MVEIKNFLGDGNPTYINVNRHDELNFFFPELTQQVSIVNGTQMTKMFGPLNVPFVNNGICRKLFFSEIKLGV